MSLRSRVVGMAGAAALAVGLTACPPDDPRGPREVPSSDGPGETEMGTLESARERGTSVASDTVRMDVPGNPPDAEATQRPEEVGPAPLPGGFDTAGAGTNRRQ